MERHVPRRPARRRLRAAHALAALLALAIAGCGLVPVASFSRPPEAAPTAEVQSPPPAPSAEKAPAPEVVAESATPTPQAAPPDLPERPSAPVVAAEQQVAPEPPVSEQPQVSAEAPASAEPQAGEVESSAHTAPASAPVEQAGNANGAAAGEPAGRTGDAAPGAPVTERSETSEPLDDVAQQAEVLALLEDFYAAYNAREWKRARALFWSGATITDVRILPESPTPAVKVASVAEFFDELARSREAGPAGFHGRLEGAPKVRAASNVAQAWCHFQARFGGPEETMSWRRVDVFTFVRHEGTWKIAALAQSNSFDTQ